MTPIAARLREAQVAVMLLTRLPAGSMSGDAPSLSASRWAFPWVGLPVGLIGWAVHAGALGIGAAPLVAAFLAFGALALATGTLHLDGLADTADGLGGGRDRAHALEIMRDSRIGSYGVVALVLMAGLWTVSLATLGGAAGLTAFLTVAIVSRAAMLPVQTLTPTARDDGLGVLAGGTARGAVVSLAATGLTVLILLGLTGMAVLATAAVVAAAVAALAIRKIGGHTGDILGATQATTETAAWLILSILLTT